MSGKYLSRLNADQRRAVTYGTKAGSKKLPRPLLILAGAGTGKTHTIAARITHCVVNGADPERILHLAFGRRAAQEMSERTTKSLRLAGHRKVRLQWTGTFHSIAARFVRKYARRVGLQPNFTIIDPPEAATLMASARAKLSLPDNEVCLKIYSALNNTGNKLAQVLADYDQKLVKDEDALRRLFRRYERAKLAANVADFDDLLKFWLVLLSEDQIGAKVRERFDYVFVDEYQDTNWLQAQILLKLKPDGRGLTVVGDDAQSIYAFRGARVANILEFPASFSSPAKVLKLEQNYRSTQPILAVCNAVLHGSGSQKVLWSNRESKRLPTWVKAQHGRAQAQYVAESIIRWQKRGGAWSDCAVLVREALHSTELEGEFARQGIPFRKYGGPKFLEAPIVRAAVAVLRWCDNSRDGAALHPARPPGAGWPVAPRVARPADGSGRPHRGRSSHAS
jgi:DNA helicase-2/ATP-dependent DNA helicase PcrA